MGAIKGKKQKWSYKTGKGKEIYHRLEEDLDRIGVWGVNLRKMSRETGVPDQTLNNWKDRIIREKGPVDVYKAGWHIADCLKKNIAICQKDLDDPDISVTNKSSIRRNLVDMGKAYAEILEKFGHKDVVAKKIKVEGTLWNELVDIYKDGDE
jgi:hypothetical protein